MKKIIFVLLLTTSFYSLAQESSRNLTAQQTTYEALSCIGTGITGGRPFAVFNMIYRVDDNTLLNKFQISREFSSKDDCFSQLQEMYQR